MIARDPRNTPAWRRLRVQCYERDRARNAVCWQCKQPIDYNARPSSTPTSYEPDHRMPVETHPQLALVPENVMPCCRRCNRARGKRAGIDALGVQSHDWANGKWDLFEKG